MLGTEFIFKSMNSVKRCSYPLQSILCAYTSTKNECKTDIPGPWMTKTYIYRKLELGEKKILYYIKQFLGFVFSQLKTS